MIEVEHKWLQNYFWGSHNYDKKEICMLQHGNLSKIYFKQKNESSCKAVGKQLYKS